VNVVIPPLAVDGPSLTIRRFRRNGMSAADLVEAGTLSAPLLDFLAGAVRSRCNLLICGGTGSGKTTTLNALSEFIDPAERVVTIEDAAELRLRQPHVIRLEARPPSVEGRGEVTIRRLVRNALRMRPDRIVVGEVRGPEAPRLKIRPLLRCIDARELPASHRFLSAPTTTLGGDTHRRSVGVAASLGLRSRASAPAGRPHLPR
jgi:Flp pilus assembly CpaF family ATPase